MSSLDIFSMGIRNLFKRKLMTFLTVLGVIVGTTSIVTMLSLGIGINESFDKQIQEMGDLTVITVYRPYDSVSYSSDGTSSISSAAGMPTLNDDAVQKFNNLEGVVIATPVMEMYLKFVSGKYTAHIPVKGMEPEAMEAMGYKLDDGRLIDPVSDKYEILFGTEIAYRFQRSDDRNAWRNMYGENRKANVDLLSEKISMHYNYSYGEKNSPEAVGLKGYNITTAGMLSYVDGWSGYDTNNYAFMDIKKLKKIRDDQKLADRRAGIKNSDTYTGYEMVYVKCSDIKTVTKVLDTIKNEMNFQAYNYTEYVNTMKETSASLQMLLGAIGAVSLFVAAIGIANTMTMSIYERTREIGVMKVIGASLWDIKRLFLFEAAMIGFFGGFFGIFLSLGLSHVINTVGLSFISRIVYTPEGSVVSSIPLWLCGSALVFSSFIGVISGYMPARRATKISALTAIRTE